MDFFPSWTGSSFFAQDSTDWEPAAIEKRNPRIRSNNSECLIAIMMNERIEGGGAGGKRMPIESGEKNILRRHDLNDLNDLNDLYDLNDLN